MSLQDRWQIEIERLKREGRYRSLTPPSGIDFSSNDYLGYSKRALGGQPREAEMSRSGAASRLLRGQHPIWQEVEARLAAWHRAEAALIMTSGYVANEGLLGTLTEPGDLVFSDQLNHASIIDGLRIGKADKRIFPHNDVQALEAVMGREAGARKLGVAWFIVTESMFGMEGDRAPLAELAELSRRYDAHLIVDEAHATGCFGAIGSGLVDAAGLRNRILAGVHTGGKALAVPGAYIVGSSRLKELLVNRCRHLIFTTALPPAIGAWWLDAIDVVARDEMARRRLHGNASYFRAEMRQRGCTVGGTDYIATVPIGGDAAAVEVARHLQGAGFDIRAIRPPTVPPGTARLRIVIHADHAAATIRELANVLANALPSMP